MSTAEQPLTEAHLKRASLSEEPSKVYELRLAGLGVTHIRGLAPFVRLRSLDLSGNRIERLEGISANTDLRELALFNNRLTGTLEAPSLAQCSKELQRLLLHMNRITSISAGTLANAKKLRVLRLDHNRLTGGLDFLVGCSQSLVSLDITNNPIDSLSGLPVLPKLTDLHASFTGISDKDVSCVIPRCCPSLVELHLCNTRIASSLGSLSVIRGLEVLALDACPIQSISAAFSKPLSVLLSLSLRGCRGIADLCGVPTLFPSLESLDVTSCSIASAESVLQLAPLSSLRELFVNGNPVSASPDSFRWTVSSALSSLVVLDDVNLRRAPVSGSVSGDDEFASEPTASEKSSETRPPSAAMSAASAPSNIGNNATSSSRPSTGSMNSRPQSGALSARGSGGPFLKGMTPWATPSGSRAATPAAVPGQVVSTGPPVLLPMNTAAILAARVMTPQEAEGLGTPTGLSALTKRMEALRSSLGSRNGGKSQQQQPLAEQQERVSTAQRLKPIEVKAQQLLLLQQSSLTRSTAPQPPAASPKKPKRSSPRKEGQKPQQQPTQQQTPPKQQTAQPQQQQQPPLPPDPDVPVRQAIGPLQEADAATQLPLQEYPQEGGPKESDDREAHKRGPLTRNEQVGYRSFRLPARSVSSRHRLRSRQNGSTKR